ncbi:MAG: metallophosphoesterase, partial [Phycisphaeraceae bacterium]
LGNKLDAADSGGGRKRVLGVAHLTDTHVMPERISEAGMTAALHHVQSLNAPPELILPGGDAIMDSFATDKARADAQWKIWHRVLQDECSLPVRNCIGNHDLWGWDKPSSKTTGDEPGWGKARAVSEFGSADRYYSFDQAGWRFVVLDSTHPRGESEYVGKLDEPQFEWLAAQLQRTPAAMPILMLSHIPILAAAAFFDGDNEASGNWRVPGAWMHIDARRIKDLFAKHPNVKGCLAGHLHLIDQVRYNDVTYCCNGAVSGGWWQGPNRDCNTGYGLVDLYDDGTFENRYVVYDWQV